MLKTMHHSDYQRKIRDYSDECLHHTIRDCQEVIRLQSEFNPNCGYYADEIHYCRMELNRRKKLDKCPTCGKIK